MTMGTPDNLVDLLAVILSNVVAFLLGRKARKGR